MTEVFVKLRGQKNYLHMPSANEKPPAKAEGSSIELSFDYAARALRANHRLSFLFPADVALYDIVIVGDIPTLII